MQSNKKNPKKRTALVLLFVALMSGGVVIYLFSQEGIISHIIGSAISVLVACNFALAPLLFVGPLKTFLKNLFQATEKIYTKWVAISLMSINTFVLSSVIAVALFTPLIQKNLASADPVVGISVLAASIAVLVALIGAYLFIFNQGKYVEAEKRILSNLDARVARYEERTEKSKNAIEQIIESKKKNFLNPGISFHYADHKQIKIFYDITFKEATIESVISERTGEISGQVKGSIYESSLIFLKPFPRQEREKE